MKKIYNTMLMLTIMMGAMATMTSCEEDDDYIAQQLRDGDWQGYVSAYYNDRWGISGSNYATVMRFESKGEYYTSGRGYELDYNTYSPHQDYAYCTFKWFIVDGEITLIYDDDRWQPIYIVDYSLGNSWFRGYIYDGTSRRIRFEFENVAYDDWGYYNRTGGYGDFSDQHYYYSRMKDINSCEDDSVPFINRTNEARQRSGEVEAVSIASGVFAEAILKKK